ncbi:MAG: tetratricopeptide repeat protein [Gallionella sp.]|nr:tetratricopeptide repeat protein [Gallionella sp.]
MNMFNRFYRQTALLAGAMLLSASLTAQADDMQDANQLFKQGQHGQALDKVNGYLANKPKDAQARFLKGLILTEQDKAADAIRIFSALTSDYPDLPEPYNNLAVLYAGQGQYDKAKQSLEMAIRTHPSYATAHENLGDIYAKMASQAYDRALQLDRGNAATQTKLAMIKDLFAGDTHGKASITPNNPVAAPIETLALDKECPEPCRTAEHTAPENIAPGKPMPVTGKLAQAENAPAVPPAADDSSELLSTVKAWAAAWSSQNVEKYLSFYADDFITPGGETRAAWSETRKQRISAPKSIQIDISNVTFKFGDSGHATVKFRQTYHANHLKTSGTKTLLMVKSGEKWLIQEERTR